MSFRRTISGAAMLSAVRMIRLAAQFVTVPILSRLLAPEEYGLIAISMPFALFAMMIADAGIGMSLVRTPASRRTEWSTCFWMATMLGAVLALVMAALGPAAAHFFNEPILTPMIATLSFLVLAQAIHLIPVAALQQAGKFHIIAGIDIVSTAVSFAVAIYMAYHGFGAWSLVGQQVSYFAIRVVSVCILSPFRPLWVFRWRETHEHLRFGRNILGSSLMVYCSRQLDNWVVGKALATAALGFYSMAFQFARLPAMLVSGPLNYAMYAWLASIKDDQVAIGRAFVITTRLLAILIFPVMGMVAVAHTPIFNLLLSEKWHMAGVLFMLLAPATATQAVGAVSETVTYALGRTDIQLRRTTEYSILWIGTLIAAVSFGLEAAAIAYCACTLLYHIRYIALTLPLMQFTLRQYFATYVIPLLATATAIATYMLIAPSLIAWQQIVLSALLALTGVAVGFLLQRQRVLAEIRQWNRSHDDAVVPED